MSNTAVAPFKLKSFLEAADPDLRYRDLTAWIYTDPSIVAAAMPAIGEDIYTVVRSSAATVREGLHASALWKEAAKKAVTPATRKAEGKVDPTKVAPYYERFCALAHALVETEFKKQTRISLDDIWNTTDVIFALGSPSEFIDSLRVDDEDQMWSIDNIRELFEVLYEPFFEPAKAADFYSRSRLAIRSLVARTETKTLFGVRNTKEIDLAVYKLIEQKHPGWGYRMSPVILYLHDTDTDRSKNVVNGHDFELHCAEIIRSAGHKVEITQASADKGVDLLVETHEYRIAVQCKMLNKPAGIKAVQEVVAGAKHYKADYGVVVCDAGFTQAAEDLAASNGVALANTRSIQRLDALF